MGETSKKSIHYFIFDDPFFFFAHTIGIINVTRITYKCAGVYVGYTIGFDRVPCRWWPDNRSVLTSTTGTRYGSKNRFDRPGITFNHVSRARARKPRSAVDARRSLKRYRRRSPTLVLTPLR